MPLCPPHLISLRFNYLLRYSSYKHSLRLRVPCNCALKLCITSWLCHRSGVCFKTETKTALLGKNRTATKTSVQSRVWGRIGLTEDVADILNDAFFKLFLIRLLNDFLGTLSGETTVKRWVGGGCTWKSVQCGRLWDRTSVPINRTFPRLSNVVTKGASVHLDVCCPCILCYWTVLLPDIDSSLVHNLHFT